MRKFDKLYNLQKANLLAEQRYLESKGLLKEEFKKRPEITWIGDTKQLGQGKVVNFGDIGEYIGRQGGEVVVSFNGMNFYTSEGTFELSNNSNISDLKEGSEEFDSIRLIYKNDIDKFIKSNPALGSIYDEDTKKFKLYLYADLVGYYDPKYGRIDYKKNSRFAKMADEYTWDRNINQ